MRNIAALMAVLVAISLLAAGCIRPKDSPSFTCPDGTLVSNYSLCGKAGAASGFDWPSPKPAEKASPKPVASPVQTEVAATPGDGGWEATPYATPSVDGQAVSPTPWATLGPSDLEQPPPPPA